MPNKKSNPDLSLRQHLVDLLKGGNAHASFDQAVEGIPPNLRGEKPPNFPHSPWMLLEHLRIALWDILEFSRDKKHVSPKWPEGYWPADKAPSSAEWNASIKNFRKNMAAMQNLVTNRQDRFVCPHSLGRRPNHPAPGPAGRRS